MGKKSKKQKLIKKGETNSLHLKRINIYENTAAFLRKEHFSLELLGRLRDCYAVDLKFIQGMKNIRQDYEAVNRDILHDENLLSMLWESVNTQMRAQEYSRALELCKEVIKVIDDNPMRNIYLSCIDLFLLQIEGFSAARVTRVSQQVHELVKINELGSKWPLYITFIDCALGELNRLRQFDMVNDLALAMMQHKNNFIISHGEVFAKMSCVDLIRSAIINEDLDKVDLEKVNEILEDTNSQDSIDYEEAGIRFLALSLIVFYMTYISAASISEHQYTDMLYTAYQYLQHYLEAKIERSTWKCCLCEEKKSSVNEHLICQGCRVVSYCCKECQRSNYLYSEQTRTRGLGHKHLCPVFKAFRKLENNEDASKNELLQRKYWRACHRFFLSTLDTFKEESEM